MFEHVRGLARGTMPVWCFTVGAPICGVIRGAASEYFLARCPSVAGFANFPGATSNEEFF